MAVYAFWNNKGGVGKSYLTFQVACEYARTHPNEKILVIDSCPQANASSMLLGGMQAGEIQLEKLCTGANRPTIAGYIRARISSPYHNPRTGASFLTQVSTINAAVPENLHLVCGDAELEILSSRVFGATHPGPDDAWAKVHLWLSDLIEDIRSMWDTNKLTVFIDTNPSFSIYTELALSASDRLIIPFSADGSSKRAVRTLLALVFGVAPSSGAQQSEFYLNTKRYRTQTPKIYCYVGNRLTQMNQSSAQAFRTVVTEIGNEIWKVWQTQNGVFCVHPGSAAPPTNQKEFNHMFQYEIVDANTASVVSSSLGIPIVALSATQHVVAGKAITVNQSQLSKQVPNIQALVATIE
jgi:chromosome partitioning protein